MPLNNAKITKSACYQMLRNRNKLPHLRTTTTLRCRPHTRTPKSVYAVHQTCAKTL